MAILTIFKVSTTKMKLDGMFKMKFYNFAIFSDGTQNCSNGTQIFTSTLLDHFYAYSASFRPNFTDFGGGCPT